MRATEARFEVASGAMPSSPRRRWIMVRAQARDAPTRMDWAWVSVPK